MFYEQSVRVQRYQQSENLLVWRTDLLTNFNNWIATSWQAVNGVFGLHHLGILGLVESNICSSPTVQWEGAQHASFGWSHQWLWYSPYLMFLQLSNPCRNWPDWVILRKAGRCHHHHCCCCWPSPFTQRPSYQSRFMHRAMLFDDQLYFPQQDKCFKLSR